MIDFVSGHHYLLYVALYLRYLIVYLLPTVFLFRNVGIICLSSPHGV